MSLRLTTAIRPGEAIMSNGKTAAKGGAAGRVAFIDGREELPILKISTT